MERPVRKTTRLKDYDYSQPGYYFITICTKNREKLLCTIVGTGLPDGPEIHFTQYGKVVQSRLEEMALFYNDIVLEKYVIMPNHVHLLLHIVDLIPEDGSSRKPFSTYELSSSENRTNTSLSRFIGTMKCFTNREIGRNIWQYRSHDHVIRGDTDYHKIWMYIETNPQRWEKDCFYD